MSIPLPPTFRYRKIDVNGVRINTVVGGDGPPLLLLHGYPQTHLIWHEVAPRLARRDGDTRVRPVRCRRT
jgi:haloacetate dehalogenase